MYQRLILAWVMATTLLSALAAEPIILRFSWWGGSDRHEAMQKALRLFEERNPGVKVRGEPGAFNSNYRERFAQIMAQGAEADVMQINWAWLSRYSPRGDGFYDLYRVRNQLKLDEFPDECFKSGLILGKLNALPVSNTARVFLWQKSTFDKAGLPLPKTWDQLLIAGRTFRDRLGSDYYPLQGGDEATYLTHAYIFQKTGRPYIYPNQPKVALSLDEITEWVRFYRRLLDEHVIVPFAIRNASTAGQAQQQPSWVEGKWAGAYNWDSTLSLRASTSLKGTQLEVGDFLTMPGAKNSGMFGRPALMYAVSKRSKHPELAARLINFLLTDVDALHTLQTLRGLPVTRTGIRETAGMQQSYERKAVEQIRNTRIDYPSPFFELPAIQDLLRNVFRQVDLKQLTEREAALRLLNEGNRLLYQR